MLRIWKGSCARWIARRREGIRRILLLVAEMRFGEIPGWARRKIDAISSADLRDTSLALLDAPSLEHLLP
jgi:hypothetical protein